MSREPSRPRRGRAEFVPGRAISDDLVAAWRSLAQRSAEPNLFAEPEIVLPSVTHLARGGRAGILTVRNDERLLGVLPVEWPVHVGRSALPVVQGWVEPYRPLGGPLLDAEHAVDAVAALLRPPVALAAPLMLLRYFPEDGPVAAALDEALAREGRTSLTLKTYERALLLRDGGPAPSKNRKNRYSRLRRQREALAAALGPVRVVDRSDDPGAIEEFLALEMSGWKGRAGTALACTDGHAAWFREVCDLLRAAGRLEVLSAEAGGRTTAMWVDFDDGEGSIHFKSAYDEDLGEHRPGELLLLHCVENANESRYAWRDSATVPDNTLFNQLWPSRRRLSTRLVPLHGRIGDTALAAAGALLRLRDRRQGERATGA
ncbi:hypothetical protein DQ237_10255 [Blastococcus sp. TF02-8]|uniref:GNAT family N-acetyltransferase n=1 Tax=Blastococcus sp. TF02-8 TaxID=2250574 RepID=UPI000DE85CDE|nr:GNAT family N-acetyltransferase [Blastococcus sp. TF02-8]RBY96235.1 hypothetical protein DQ237_10255 [Blastococcus sp. TF02-8]